MIENIFGLKVFEPTSTKIGETFSKDGRLEYSLAVGENGFKKVKLTSQKLEKTGNGNKMKQVALIDFYVDAPVFLSKLFNPIRNARFRDLIKKDIDKAHKTIQEGGEVKFGVELFKAQGGTTAARLKGDKARKGNAEYREFKISRSAYYDKNITSSDPKEKAKAIKPRFIVEALKCDGKELDQGGGKLLITPIKTKDGKYQNAEKIMIPIQTYDELVGIVEEIYLDLMAYRTAQYTTSAMRRMLDELFAKLYSKVRKLLNKDEENNADFENEVETLVTGAIDNEEVENVEAVADEEDVEEEDDDVIF